MATRRNPRSSATHCRGACVHVWLRGLEGLREKHIDRVVFEGRVRQQHSDEAEQDRQPAYGPRSPSGSQSTIPGCPTTISSAKAKIRS